jgi:hypothetical protein|uniref:Uncharacterized protein n=1 Tax=virus sp. ctFlR8 TaxID=2825811 RepID=A0A8S5RN39_9VIRU|nr:MAG TPA: hypothetical protein [virus sp. ctFlR8]DAH08271.1 MAG TPA: hypothetical protein [Bacteriophage sp.]
MVKRKFKVGERYKSGYFADNDAVIEITEISGGTVFYKDVVGESIGLKHFQIGSIFSAALEKVDTTIVIYRNDNKVVALDKSTGEKAEANCNPADEFDFRTGAKLAFNRLMGEDAKPDNGVREVKRKAKVGEYIKVVYAMPCLIPYKNGDIFKVNCVTTSGCICKKSEENVGLWHKEYVVLENYEPEKEPEKKDEICVGDTVKVTNTSKQYNLYDTWSGLLGYKQNFVIGSDVKNEDEYKVLRIKKHDRFASTIALIQNPKTTQVFIIGIDGIKKVER